MRPTGAALVCALALVRSAAGGPDATTTTTTATVADTTATIATSSSTTESTITASSTTGAPPTTTSTTTATTLGTVPETTTTSTVVTTTGAPPAGGCVPDDPRSCDDGDPCTRDACDAASRTCVHVPLGGTPCPDDGVACTEDRCASGVCVHTARDVLCDRGACAVRACRPGDPAADRRGCIVVEDGSGTDGTPCTGDGFSCTEDVCMSGLCLHMPVDSACTPAGGCQAAACRPAAAGHDAAGCVAGAARREGDTCAEDADACTLDVCRAGTCAHERVTDQGACAPVQDVFHQTIALGDLTEEIGADVSSAASSAVQPIVDRLAQIDADLAAAAAALSGRSGIGASVAGAAAGDPTPSAQRARIAFTVVLRTPREVSSFLQTLAEARTRAALGRSAVRQLRQRGRQLLHGTRRLRSTLRTLAR